MQLFLTMTTLIKKQAAVRDERGAVVTVYPAPFIVGVSRSGTTLLRMMLDSHPDLAILPETHFIPRIAGACAHSDEPREEFIRLLTSDPLWGDFNIDDEILRERVEALSHFTTGDALRAFYTIYCERFGKFRWGDKTPPYTQFMYLIQELLPEARFIHIIRDGRDVALSVKDLWFGPNSVPEAAGWWKRRIRQARAQIPHLRSYLEIRYEDLVTDTASTMKSVCDFIELPWDPVILDASQRAEERLAELERDAVIPHGPDGIPAGTRTVIHSLVNMPPLSSRIGRWRSEMCDSDCRVFEEISGDLLKELGYE
jgi:hypothetical protein